MRYILDNKFHLTTFLEDDTKSNGYSSKELPWLLDIVKDFVLPVGFPGFVSYDYLEYMLLQFPTNVTGWICHTLITSSLIKAVGLDYSSGTTAAASAAAIRWMSKDGIGAIGRFFIGERFGNLLMMIQNNGSCTSLEVLEASLISLRLSILHISSQ